MMKNSAKTYEQLEQEIDEQQISWHHMNQPFEKLSFRDKLHATRYVIEHDRHLIDVPFGDLIDEAKVESFKGHVRRVLLTELDDIIRLVDGDDGVTVRLQVTCCGYKPLRVRLLHPSMVAFARFMGLRVDSAVGNTRHREEEGFNLLLAPPNELYKKALDHHWTLGGQVVVHWDSQEWRGLRRACVKDWILRVRRDLGQVWHESVAAKIGQHYT